MITFWKKLYQLFAGQFSGGKAKRLGPGWICRYSMAALEAVASRSGLLAKK
jgi:hypothetical protein